MTDRVLSFEAALAEVHKHAAEIGRVRRKEEYVPLLEAAGRVLALPLAADRDQPPFPRSTRDGYAVFSTDPAWGSGTFRIVGQVRAGGQWAGPHLQAGEAIEIMTGAPLPPGADAVLMVEHAQVRDSFVCATSDRRLEAGENVVSQGAEAAAYQTVLPQGRILRAAEIAVAASVGQKNVAVESKPRVAIVATGDELVELDSEPQPWQIRNSNSYALAALVQAESAIPESHSIAQDTESDLRERIRQGRHADLLLLSGGVSMGKYDLVEQVLLEAGAELIFTGALIQPGKPVVFGRLSRDSNTTSSASFEGTGLQPRRHDSSHKVASATEGTPPGPRATPYTYFFGLPGNPVSTQVCFHLFVAPMLRALAGRTDIAPQFVEARLAEDVKGGSRVTRFLPAELAGDWRGVTVRVVGWQGSGDLAANARGNSYVVLPAGIEAFQAGDSVRVLLR